MCQPVQAAATAAGAEAAKQEEEGEAVEDPRGEWRTAFTEDGRIYYWNVRTRASTWQKPY